MMKRLIKKFTKKPAPKKKIPAKKIIKKATPQKAMPKQKPEQSPSSKRKIVTAEGWRRLMQGKKKKD